MSAPALPPLKFLTASLLLTLLLALLSACSESAPAPDGVGFAAGQESGPASIARGGELAGRILFARRGEIWIWQGREGRALIGGDVAQPAWSPDGAHIAYITRGPSYSNLMLADAAGNYQAQLTDNGSSLPPTSIERVHETTWALYPTWSPDGTQLALTGQQAPPLPGDPAVEHNLALYMLTAAGGHATLLLSDEEAHYSRPVFAPDGASLAFTRTPVAADGQQQLYWLDIAAGAAAPFPAAPTPSYDPAFSRDGRWLAFAVRSGEGTDIFALPADPAVAGGTPRRITDLGTARAPAFSPDGRQLAFLAVPPGGGGFELWVADLSEAEDGTLAIEAPRQVSEGLAIDADSGLSWAP